MRSRKENGCIHLPALAKLRLCLLCLCALFTLPAFGQRANEHADAETRLGISLGFGSNFSSTEIQEFAGSELCGVFRHGSNVGYSFGLEAEIPVGPLSFIPAIGYQDLSSRFQTSPFVLEHAFDLANTQLISIERRREYLATISALSVQAAIGWRPWENIRLQAGFGCGLFTSHSYRTTERLLTDNVVYADNSLSTKDLVQGSLDVKPVQFTTSVGGQYDIVFDRTVLSPRVTLQLPLTSITGTGSSSYKTISLLGGVSLQYRFGHEKETQPVIAASTPIIASPPTKEDRRPVHQSLALQVRAIGLTENGEEIPEPIVAIENVRVTDISPTLNYIFFDDGDSRIPDRYNQFSAATESAKFDPASLFSLNAQGLHYDILNIIGQRLRNDPKATITLTGTRSVHGLDSAESTNLALSRASNVARYLQDLWGISSSRIRIRSHGLPDKPSDETTASGQAENRRVEISANPSTILGPVETKKLERTATPPRLMFDPVITSTNAITKFTITIKHGDQVLQKIDGLSDANQHWLWNIPAEELTAHNDSVTWIAEVEDSVGATASLTGAIRIRKSEAFKDISRFDTTADKSLERFNLLLFDYSATSSTNEQAYTSLLDRVAKAVTPDARITLIGHTDITGDPAFNDRLSLDRASKASFLLSTRLRTLGIQAPQLSLEGHGARDVLYDNSYAEGRMLSRTVRIFIERDLRK